MNHPAELAINQYLEDATSGKSTMSEETIEQIGKDVMDAVRRQFGGGNRRDKFRLRMSNIGRPTCQLWFEKNKPEKALPKPTTFVMNMLLGDIVEAAFKGIITEAGVHYEDEDNYVELELDNTTVKGSYDLVINGAVDDVKSASDWSYRNKFESYQTLKASDPFGYVGQLAGYAKASGKKAGGWWVVNKANGNIKYIAAAGAFVGWQKVLLIIFISAVLGTFVGLFQIGFQKKTRKNVIPFGPLLSVATWITLFYGNLLIKLYMENLWGGLAEIKIFKFS